MNKDKNLHKLLNRPQAPKELEKNLRENWEQQQKDNKSLGRYPIGAVAASVMLAFITIFNLNNTPEVVTLALEDIANDSKHNVGISRELDAIKRDFNIQLPPDNMPVKMTKYCDLNEAKTMHLTIAGARQGEVHLFLYQGDFDTAFWAEKDGKIDSMPWQLTKPRDDLSVLVVYSADMNPDSVKRLIRQMLFS